MMGQCVIRATSSQYLEFVGNVPSALTMTCVQSVTTVTNITCDIVFSGLTHLEVKGLFMGNVVDDSFLLLSCVLSDLVL